MDTNKKIYKHLWASKVDCHSAEFMSWCKVILHLSGAGGSTKSVTFFFLSYLHLHFKSGFFKGLITYWSSVVIYSRILQS